MAEETVDHRASLIVNDYLDDNRFCNEKNRGNPTQCMLT